MSTRFADRHDAGRALAAALSVYAGRSDLVVLALPRGGVPVAAEVAQALGAPLDVFVVRKLGVPGHEELALGAIASGGARVLNAHVLRSLGVSREEVEGIAQRELAELERRERAYRGGRHAAEVAGRTVILVDDGLATGASMAAAVTALRARAPARLIVAVPVGARESVEALRDMVDDIVVPRTPEPFHAVGLWYEDFAQTTDEEVRALLGAAATHDPSREVRIPSGSAMLAGELVHPQGARALVLAAHASSSGRPCSCTAPLMQALGAAGLATLLLDLLTPPERRADRSAGRRQVDVGLLAQRLEDAAHWVREQDALARLPIAYIGMEGAAPAVLVAAARDRRIRTVVSFGGRPDLAGDALAHLSCPVLFIVGGRDPAVLELAHAAREVMTSRAEVAVVPGATHLFEEPGAAEHAARAARTWLLHRVEQPVPTPLPT